MIDPPNGQDDHAERASDEMPKERPPHHELTKTAIAPMRQVTFPPIETPILLPPALLADLDKFGAKFRQMCEQMLGALTKTADIFRDVGWRLERYTRIESAGWLPHYTTPSDLILVDMSAEEISATIEHYYRENWREVESAFLQRQEQRELDDDAKAAFEEALACHRHGLYRSVPRTLFPEIERVACAKLYEGSREYHKKDTKNGKSLKLGITSLPDFAERVAKLPAGNVLTADYGIPLYSKLEKHLYQPVRLPEEIAVATADSVPNRHATLHGIVTYKTMQSSLNALIMADYIFHLIEQVRAFQSELKK